MDKTFNPNHCHKAVRRTACLLSVLLALCYSAPLVANNGHGVDLPQSQDKGLPPQSVDLCSGIRVILNRGHAKLLVQRVLGEPAPGTNEVEAPIMEPGVVTSVRALGSLGGKPFWFQAQLHPAATALDAYANATATADLGTPYRVLLSQPADEPTTLRVSPWFAHEQKTLAYTVEMPMTYARGRYFLEMPTGDPRQSARFTVESAVVGDRVFVDDHAIDSQRSFSLAEPHGLELEPRTGTLGELAVVDTGLGRSYAHVQFALANRISHVPNNAYVVLGIDNSRSMGELRHSALEMAEGTLRLFPNARVQILDFSRTPHPRFTGFVSVSEALRSLRREMDRKQSHEENGSEVDLALSEAERLLAHVPANHPKRILFFTDTITSWRITSSSIAANVGASGAVVHIVDVDTPRFELIERADEHPWASAIRHTGGLVWGLRRPGHCVNIIEGQSAASPYLPLVRPTVLYDAKFSLSASPEDSERLGDMVEGSGLERQGLFDGAVRWARLTGELWSRPFQLTLEPDPSAGKTWSALIFATDYGEKLSPAETVVVAMRGGAVTPLTSYVMTARGPRSQELPASWGDVIGSAFAGDRRNPGIFFDCHGSYREFQMSLRGVPFDSRALLTDQLAAKWAECGGKKGQARISLETHYSEIGDVRVTLEIDDPAKHLCLQEAAWALDLQPYPFDDKFRSWEIQL